MSDDTREERAMFAAEQIPLPNIDSPMHAVCRRLDRISIELAHANDLQAVANGIASDRAYDSFPGVV